MKSIKRIIALLLTAVMTMTMSVTAFAVNTDCSLTVNVKDGQDLNGQTISLYKLFDLSTSKSDGKTNYAYTVNKAEGYKDALKSVLGDSFSGTTDEDYAKAVLELGANDSEKVQKFANDFTAKALTGSLEATQTSGKIVESKTSYKFTGLNAGYYLVYVTGAKKIQSSLVTVDGETEVSLKTEAPSITKTADKDTVSIGQVVKYTVAGSVPDTTGYDKYVYKINDTLSSGLDFVNDSNGTAVNGDKVNVTVAFKDEGVTDAGTAPTKATLTGTNKRTMALDLSAWVKDNQTNKGKAFTVTYYAKVNQDAVVTEKNKAQLEYGNKPGETTTTTPSEAKTPTYPLDILKTKKDTKEKLAGAKFSLYESEVDAKNGEHAIKVSGSNGNYVVDPNSTDTVFESVESITGVEGYNLHVNGLAEGTYYLVETEAPAGYNKLTAPIVIKITKSTDTDVNNWTISKGSTVEKDKIIDVENSTGSILPSTGGMGTIAFAVVAAILVFGVAVSFIRDKKREN